MKKTLSVTVSALCLLMGGCATIVEGTDQVVLFDSDPSGAECSIARAGEGLLYPKFITPTSLSISKDKDQLTITCNKEGYEQKLFYTDSNFAGWTMGNLIFGGVIGVGVDAATGALNEYPSHVLIPLRKKEE